MDPTSKKMSYKIVNKDHHLTFKKSMMMVNSLREAVKWYEILEWIFQGGKNLASSWIIQCEINYALQVVDIISCIDTCIYMHG